MTRNGSDKVFNTIAPIYGLFFDYQRRQFLRSFEQARGHLDISLYRTVLDVGCGTGALCAVLHEKGLAVTGLDPAVRMLDIARKKLRNSPITLIQGNILQSLPFADKSFDVTITSFVAHGLQPDERKILYREMSRLSLHQVIIYDYNQKRSPLTTFLEWLEKGDYFRFIQQVPTEMVDCLSDLKQCFSSVEVIPTDGQASFYVCTPKV